MRRLLLLDRDGVINHDSDDYIKTLDEWIPVPGSIDAMAELYHGGWDIAVVTNQSGVGRGYYAIAVLDAMHDRLRELLAAKGAELAGIYYCPHLPDAGCDCRKPRPGLLHAAGRDSGLSLTDAVMIGDSLKDLQAARAVGATPVLVTTGKGAATLKQIAGDSAWQDVAVFSDLRAAAAKLRC